MIDAALSALQDLLVPVRLLFLFMGVLMGLVLGAIPGLGGLVGLAILLPFTFDMDPTMAFAIMIGLLSITSTSDTIPSVLFGVPGTAASQATIMDGHPMAKRGEAGRALGAAYMASLIGGLFGALVLALMIPVLRPIVMAFGAPEFFMMGILGISMVAVLSGRAPLKGMVAGAVGMTVGMVGMDPQSGVHRWVFNQLYLMDGLPLVPVSLGIFAIPEVVDLVIKGTRIADVPKEALKGVMTGIRDALRHWFLIIRCSALGVWIGAIPGLGAAVVDWFAYGHAMQSERGATETFGKGDVRGVIAPESANNAKEGGALVPTVAFGVPGSASMALLLGAMTIQGLTPGPAMLSTHLDVTFTLVWSIAIANIFGTALCLLSTNLLAKVSLVRIHLLAPLITAMVFLAAYQSSRNYGDLWSLLFFSVLGWFMKRFGWPRPPIILGLVLSKIIENNLNITVTRYGAAWLSRPIVIAIVLLTLGSLVYGFRTQRGKVRGGAPKRRMGPVKFRFQANSLFTLVLSGLFLCAVGTAWQWQFAAARRFPFAIVIPALALCLAQLVLDFVRPRTQEDVEAGGFMDLPVDRSVPVSAVIRRATNFFAWTLGLFAGIWLVGFVVSVPLFVFLYLTLQAREKFWVSLIYVVGVAAFQIGVFHMILTVPWPGAVFPQMERIILAWF